MSDLVNLGDAKARLSWLSDCATAGASSSGARNDPFGRLRVARAKEENAVLVSAGAVFGRFGVETMWD